MTLTVGEIIEYAMANRINEAYMSMANVGIQFDEYPIAPVGVSWEDIHWPRFAAQGLLEICKTEVPQPTPEPQPALPFEVFHTVKFNESAAWEAVVALSRGC